MHKPFLRDLWTASRAQVTCVRATQARPPKQAATSTSQIPGRGQSSRPSNDDSSVRTGHWQWMSSMELLSVRQRLAHVR